MRRRLVRCVPALDFLDNDPPTYLYASGSAGRWNPEGVDCLYFSETSHVADLEYRRAFAVRTSFTEPKLTFVAEVDLKHIIDFEKSDVRKAFDLSREDLFEPWRKAPSPTRLQQLGEAIGAQQRVSAIRYPSDACRRAGTKGWNVAIFPETIVPPNSVRILGRSGTTLEEWPPAAPRRAPAGGRP
jgi:RES domain-containing protein